MKVIIKNGCIDNNMNLVVNDYRNKNKKLFRYIFKLENGRYHFDHSEIIK